MSEQVKDPFIWNNKKWDFIGAENVYSLFNPERFGLSPDSHNTACHKGFIIQFKVVDDELILDELLVYCKNNIYPPINDVFPVEGDMRMKLYKNINLKLEYSGVIMIGTNMLPEYYGRAFTGAHSYEKVYELSFEEGILLESKDTSGSYMGF